MTTTQWDGVWLMGWIGVAALAFLMWFIFKQMYVAKPVREIVRSLIFVPWVMALNVLGVVVDSTEPPSQFWLTALAALGGEAWIVVMLVRAVAAVPELWRTPTLLGKAKPSSAPDQP